MNSARHLISNASRISLRSAPTIHQTSNRICILYSRRRASTATNPSSNTSTASKPSPPPTTSSTTSAAAKPTPAPKYAAPIKRTTPPPHDLTTGLQDPLPEAPPSTSSSSTGGGGDPVDWSRSFHGLSTTAFTREASSILMEPIKPADVEVKPDGIIYLPEIKYRRILNRAFGPGAWGLAPRGETIVTPKSVTREYGLVVQGRLVSIARGEQQYFDPEGIPTATEGCKSNALMRCCKDLGIASELWDPVFIREFMSKHAKEVWVEHATTKRKKKIHMRKDVQNIPYPFIATKPTS